ncbi:MAG: hypothetical protein LBK18_00365 [Prevotellaceae bacterium]|jgi:hypothetical protein|nr:hypothetical protein [Prevotellaceae bacterium]
MRKNTYIPKFFCFAALASLLACNPAEDDSYSLGGQVPAKPNFDVQVVDNDNEVVITFPSLAITKDPQVEGVHFTAPEAGINFLVKDTETTSFSKKVFRGGSYTLYVAVVNRAGSSEPQEVPFTVTKDLLLETLSENVLTESKTISGQEFSYADLYVEKSSFITLAGSLASDDVALNLDYFKRVSTGEAQFLGESGIYTVYYNAAAKIVLLSVPVPDYPDYLVATGKNFAYPVKNGDPYYIGGYPENAAAGDVLQYVLFRKTGDKTFQATVFIKDSDVEFKPYHANGGGNVTSSWGNGGEYNYDKCTFSGVSGVFIDGGGEYHNWVAGPRADATQPYRITVSVTSDGSEKAANVSIQAVDFNGEVVEIPEEPEAPPVVDDPTAINFAAFANATIAGEAFGTLEKHLDKDSTYTLTGSFDDAGALFNVDFFERISAGSVKFLGDDGDYTLHYNKVRKHVILGVSGPAYPAYLLITGTGLGYPSKVDGMNEHTGWGFDNVRSYILCRKIGDNAYQATVYITNADWAAFKFYENTSWGNEKGYGNFTFSGITFDFAGDGAIKDIKPPASLTPGIYRMTIDLANGTLDTQPFSLEN